MRLPAQLLRQKNNVHKNIFGHLLILAGSKNMLGASALCGFAAMRSGAGLVTLGVPESLNSTLQKKISPVLMTLPLKETKEQSFSSLAFKQVQANLPKFDAVAIGPGLSLNPSTQKLILKIIETIDLPMVIDADALNAIATNLKLLKELRGIKVLTPHPGEMAKLTKKCKSAIENNREAVAKQFANANHCTLLLKGHHTIISSRTGDTFTNKTGNAGMATAGSGDVLTGMIGAFLAQGIIGFEAAKYGAYLHGKAGDLAAESKTKVSMIATDIIENIPKALRSSS